MKKLFLIAMTLMLSVGVMAQQKIQMRSANRAECMKSDMTSLKAYFSFSSLDASNVETTRGELSEIYIEGAYPNGNVGEPQLPMFTKLIAIPTGATPVVTLGAHSETEYTLSDYGIGTVSAMQAPVRKNVDPSSVEYAFNEAAYARNSYNDDPIAMVEVLGTMRGITLGRLIVQPVRYNPVAGSVKVFNDIEVNVNFENGDAEGTMQMFKSTANVAFQSVYDQIFNIDMLMGRSTRDAYTDHPDFYNTPVKMLVICYSGFQGNAALNSWLEWKLQKGYYVDIYYTSETGTTANSIKNFIKTKYNASVSAGNAYTYLIVIGDTGQVPQYMTKTIDSSIGECASDLGYSSVNFTTSSTTNYFPDMYYSRISVENTTHLTNYINKVLTYEKFEFTDGGNYLNNVILVGGWDSNWTARVAKPTINYATNYYFNSSNTTYGGFSGGTINATISTSSTQGWSGTNHGCYNGLNNGVCFLNYTAHGDKQEWQGPQFTAKQVEGVTNTGKYFFGVGNCCLTGNFNLNDASYSSNYAPSSSIGATACFGETMIRVPNAGAIAYVGCAPYSYWYEDFYWAVGAHSYSQGNYPTTSASSKGVYDVMFMDNYWNSASALLYVGNLAVQQAVNNSNTNSGISGSGDGGDCNNSAHYYFQFYHTLGDGSVMPYVTKPEANTVTIPNMVTPGTTSITVNAVAGSYVAVTDNSSVIYGVAEANSSGVATVNFTNAIPGTGTLHVVVTRQQYQPYFGTIDIAGGTQYNITVTQPQHGTISAPSQAYAGTTVTLTATPETGYCLSSWTVKQGSTNITVTNNQFTMPEGNVTVTATFVQGLAVTLASVSHGTISADPMYALQGTTINLTATPASGYEFDSWSVYKTGDANTTVSVNNNSFTMPNYPVTVSATFKSEPLTVANGTGTHSEIPFYGLYTDDNYQHTQTIYPASMLTNMQGCQITKLTYYLSSSVSKSFGSTFQVRLGTTTNSAFSNGTVNYISINDAAVYSGTLSVSGTIVEFDFSDNPYLYSSGNLVVDVRITALGSGYQSMSFYGESGSTYYSVKNRNTNSLPTTSGTSVSFMPKTTFTFTAATTEPYISLAPNSATILTGSTETLTATYGNVSGTPSITYTSSNTGVATVSGSGATATVTAVAPGTATITARMTVDGTQYTATCAVTVENPTYCTPNPTSIDGKGITTLTFGTGDYVVNNSNSNGLPSSSPYYGDYTSMVGGCEAGETATVTITYSTGSSTVYSYGTVIWVDWNKNYTFEDSEIVYTGTSAQGSNGTPQVLTATFTVPANQTADDYRMRIAGADSYFDSYLSGTSTGAHDPCFSSTYAVCHDYTLRVIAASTDPVAITVSANPTNGGTVTGAGTYDPGTTVTLTAAANEGYTFTNWTRNGVVISTNASYSFTVSNAAEYVANFTINSYMITATAVPAEGGSVSFGTRNRDDLVYDFEDGWQNWTTFQGSTTSPHSWMHNTEYVAYDSNGSQIVPECHNSSEGMMLSESYISASTSGGGDAQAVTPDNYLVSPQFRLGGSFTFYVASRMSNYPAEKFSVLVSESGNTSPSNFTHTELTVTLSDNSWHEYTIDLSDYSGMGYVAIRHYDCNDQHLLYIDDVTIVEGQDSSTSSGNYNYGETCTVTAIPNTDYHFVNWTEDGTVVSASASYSFTVTADRDLVANFSQTLPSYTVTATANPTNGGTVAGGGTFEQGQSCTLTATANTGYTFTNWTKNGTVVSTNASYTFTVNGSGDYVANFTLNSYEVTATANPAVGGTISGTGTYNHGATATLTATAAEGYTFTNWTKNGTQVSTNATYSFTVTEATTLVANFTLNSYEVSATANPTAGGTISGTGTYNHGTTATLIATANEGYSFVNWTKNGTQVSTNTTYSFTVTEATNLVANFEIVTVTTTVTFHSGWNWWSANQEITLEQLEEALGSYGISITAQDNSILSYIDGLGWDGHGLDEIDLSKMYKISMSESVDIVLNAPEADPADHPITISAGTNWIGYPVQQSMSVSEALSNLTPSAGDVIKSSSSMTMYNGTNWLLAGLRTMEPGQGYVYITSSTNQTFTYPSQTRGTAALEKNITPDNNHWVPSRSEFRNNMSVVAKVAIAEGMPLDEETEVGAFVDGECRGSAKLIYLEDTDEYMAFLLVYGNDGERVSFKVLNEDRTYDAEETLEMRSDAIVGDFMAPFELHNQSVLSLFPNPVDRGESVRMEVPANVELEGARVEVYNALGSLVLDETLTNGEREIAGIHAVGIYTVRLTDRKGNVHFGKLIVR